MVHACICSKAQVSCGVAAPQPSLDVLDPPLQTQLHLDRLPPANTTESVNFPAPHDGPGTKGPHPISATRASHDTPHRHVTLT